MVSNCQLLVVTFEESFFILLVPQIHHLMFFHVSPSTVPASPENVTLTTTSSPLRVTWTIDPLDGLVSNYTIFVTRLERGNTVVNYTSTNTQLLQYDVPNLDPYELVEVIVTASNSAGEGPWSVGVRGRTREECKFRDVSYCTAHADRCIGYYGCSQCT